MEEKQPVGGYARMGEQPGQDPPPGYSSQPQPMGAAYQPGYPPQGQPAMAQPMGYQQHHTTVVVNQPAPLILQQGQRDWSTGLCGCFEDCGTCCMGYFCPCFLLIDVSQRMGEGCCFPCCCPGALVGLRIKLRTQQNIQGTLMNDFCATHFCGVCALCQLARELRHCGM